MPVDANVDFVQNIQRGKHGNLIRTMLNVLSVPTQQSEKRPAGFGKNLLQGDAMKIIRFATRACPV